MADDRNMGNKQQDQGMSRNDQQSGGNMQQGQQGADTGRSTGGSR